LSFLAQRTTHSELRYTVSTNRIKNRLHLVIN